jgi:hypothetical protein
MAQQPESQGFRATSEIFLVLMIQQLCELFQSQVFALQTANVPIDFNTSEVSTNLAPCL